jgi:hypothetical protein
VKVKELIAQLQQEDPEAFIVAIPSRHKRETLRELRYRNKPVYDEVEFGGNERESFAKVVLIVGMTDYA